MWFTYVLQSEQSNWQYVGMTQDVERRLQEHNACQVLSTKARAPYRIVLQEEHITSGLARAREKYLKSGAGREWRKKHIPG